MAATWDGMFEDPDEGFWERLGYEGTADLRREILVTTIRRANEEGPGSFSAKLLAEHLGIAPATINYHFDSREALLAEAAFVGYALYVERVWDAVSHAKQDPTARLRTWIETAIKLQVAMRGWGPVLNYPSTSQGIAAVIDEQFRERMTSYSELHLARLIVLVGDVRRGRVTAASFGLAEVPKSVIFKNLNVVAAAASIGWSVLGVAVWQSGRHLPSDRIPESGLLEARAMKRHVDRMLDEARGK